MPLCCMGKGALITHLLRAEVAKAPAQDDGPQTYCHAGGFIRIDIIVLRLIIIKDYCDNILQNYFHIVVADCDNQIAVFEVTPVVLTPSASRPTNDFVGLVLYSGDASCVDVISFKTSSAWFHIQVTPVVLTPSASRPTNDFVGLASYSGDASCVDAISFKTSSALFHIQVLELVTCNELEWTTIGGNLFGVKFSFASTICQARNWLPLQQLLESGHASSFGQ
ncbi:hypothetical protein Taro_046433 [Colocasia esculenta]|uniref:Uncharacterized protein n=1 Tax=Colocasia esculenta TaxID=4460 RepID=A0A843WZ64_COLES|nr:hypothetical protein [Colocasia esculenta]